MTRMTRDVDRRRRAFRRPPTPEKQEQANIVTFVRSIGGAAYVLGRPSPNDGRRDRGTGQSAGLPDLWLVLPAVTRQGDVLAPLGLWWEVKRRGGRRSDEQDLFAEQCAATGTPYGCGDLDTFLAWLVARGRLRPDQVGAHHLQGRP